MDTPYARMEDSSAPLELPQTTITEKTDRHVLLQNLLKARSANHQEVDLKRRAFPAFRPVLTELSQEKSDGGTL